MKTVSLPKFRHLLFTSALFAASLVVSAQTDFTEGGEQKLIRVKPADIGPKNGKITGDEVEKGAGQGTGEKVEAAVPEKSNSAALEVIFDCSNSMNARIGGVPKIDLAKDALFHLTDTLAKTDLKTGFRVFGHDRNIDREDRVKGCVNSELIIPIAEGNAPKIRAQIPNLVAWGRTPIAYSLEQAGKDLDPFLENSPMILLISDGIESCDGDPLQTMLKLKERGVNVRAFVIGFDLNAEERAALEQIATVGNGKYYNAANYGELIKSFDKFANDVAISEAPVKEKYSNPAQGGATFEEAAEITAGRYTVWKDLPKGEYAFFKVPSTKGQRVAVKAHIQGNAIYRDGGKFREAKYANGGAMVWLHGTDGKRITGRRVQLKGEVGVWERTHTLDISGSNTVFAVGSDYDPVSRHVMFEVIVQEAGDLYEGWEAPDSLDAVNTIFEAPVNDPFYGHIGTEDKLDIYKVDLKAAGNPATLNLDLKFSDVDGPCKFLVEAYDAATKMRIARFTKLESEATLEIPTEGLDGAFISIKDNNPALYHLMNSYRFELKSK